MAEVEQKLQPSGQPTEGMTVAATSPRRSFTLTPRFRVPKPEVIIGWRSGRSSFSPRKRRNQRTPSPRTMWSASIRSAEIGDVGDVPADDDLGVRQVLPHQLAHLLHFVDVGDDRRDADHVVLVRANLFDEAVERGEVQQRAGGLDVRLDHHQAPTAMEHPQRERALGSASPGCGKAPSGSCGGCRTRRPGHRARRRSTEARVSAIRPGAWVEDTSEDDATGSVWLFTITRLPGGVGSSSEKLGRATAAVLGVIIDVVARGPTRAVYSLCNRWVILLRRMAGQEGSRGPKGCRQRLDVREHGHRKIR